VTRNLTLGIDQLYRRQPGGIGTYVRGLVGGLRQVSDPGLHVVGLAPRGEAPLASGLSIPTVTAPFSVNLLTRLWKYRASGVPKNADIVHASSMAGPYGGGVTGAIHSVALHDLLWREASSATTSRGARFHENRLAFLKRREDLRLFTSSPGLRELLVSEGFDGARIFPVRLGVDDDGQGAASEGDVSAALARQGVSGPFTLYVGTREPRKNLERLINAHGQARATNAELGPLVLVGPPGWGGVDTVDAVVLGSVPRDLLKGLYRDATVFAYVALAEGWGLPPVEALHAGTRVVVSSTTPSVKENVEALHVDPLDVDSIAQGLLNAFTSSDDEAASARRRNSVSDLTWANSALEHLAGWS
jgi:glycosyltransferase involved in cell wall biosynthesis